VQLQQDLAQQYLPSGHDLVGHQHHPNPFQPQLYQPHFQPQQSDPTGYLFGEPMNQEDPMRIGHLEMERSTAEEVFGHFPPLHDEEDDHYQKSERNE
jgi:hypothetical protein